MLKFIFAFYSFIKVGNLEGENRLPESKILSYAFIFKFLFYAFSLLLCYIIFNYKPISSDFLYKDKALWVVFFNLIIFAPILEELTFRLHLGFKGYQFGIGLLGSVILFYDSWLILSSFILYFGLLFLFHKKGVVLNRKYIIYLSAFMFGIIHVVFDDLNWLENFGNTFFMVSTRTLSGLLFTYIFFRKGILFSILFHMTWNMLPFLSYLLRYYDF